MPVLLIVLILVVVVLIVIGLRKSVLRRITVNQFQRGVRFHKGKLIDVLEPGRYWTSAATTITLLDLRLQTFTVANQEILTTDGLALKISLAGDYRIEVPRDYLLVSAYPPATLHNLAQQALRDAVAAHSFDNLLATRDEINARTLELLKPQAAVLGIVVARIEVRDITLPGDLKRAYTQVIAAQKEGLAALERARSEASSLRTLANAARLLQDHPGLLQLRAVQAIEASKGNTITLGLNGEAGTTKRRSEA